MLVRWAWNDNWAPGNSYGALYWSPTALFGGGEHGIPTYDFGRDKRSDEVFVRVEVSVALPQEWVSYEVGADYVK